MPDFAGIEPSRFKIKCGDIYDMVEIADSEGFTAFDTVFCLGIFYHITDHYRLMRLMRSFNPEVIIIDSSFVKDKAPIVQFRRENAEDPSMAIAEHDTHLTSLSGVASIGFLRMMAENSGYDVNFVPWKESEIDNVDVVRGYLPDEEKRLRRYTVRLTARPDKPTW